MLQIFTVFYFISILIPTFWFKFWNLIYIFKYILQKINFCTLTLSYLANVSFDNVTMAINASQPTLLCVITLYVCLSNFCDQDVPFLDFFVLSVVIVVVPTQEFVGREVGRIWQLDTEFNKGRRRQRSSQRRRSDIKLGI